MTYSADNRGKWTPGPWPVSGGRYDKWWDFVIGKMDNDDHGSTPQEHEANRLVLELAPDMAQAIVEGNLVMLGRLSDRLAPHIGPDTSCEGDEYD